MIMVYNAFLYSFPGSERFDEKALQCSAGDL